MSISKVSNKYFLIDKVVITKNSALMYDLYKKNSDKKAELVLQKHIPIAEDMYNALLHEHYFLFVHEEKKNMNNILLL